MARFTTVLITILVLSGAGATASSAATPPVQNVSCFIADDGAGSTEGGLGSNQPVLVEGSHPASPGCNGGSSASPPATSMNGTCQISTNQSAPCSATASASSSASTSSSVSSTGAVFGATAHGQASAAVGGTASGTIALSEQSIGGLIRFTVTTPSTFQISGSASVSGHSNSTPSAVVLFIGSGATPLFRLTDTSGATSGTLQPGTYSVQAFIDARAHANVNSGDPSAASGSSTVDASFSLTIGATNGCPGAAVPSVQVGLAVAKGCFTERQDAQGHGTGVFETDQEAWVGGFDLRPQSGAKLVLEPGNTTSPIRAEGGGVDWILSSSLSVPAPLGELKPFTASYTLGLNNAGTLERLVALPLLKGTSAQITVTWNAPGTSSKLEAEASLEDMSENVGTAFSDATGHSLGTLAAKLTLALSNGAPIDLTAAELQVPEFAVELHDSNPPLKLGFGGAKFKEATVAGKVTWSAEVTALFPWESRNGANQGAITGRLFFSDSQLAGLGLGVSGFEVPVGETGWDLTGVEGNLVLSPHLSFDIGATIQEHLKVGGTPVLKSTLSIKGFQLAATDCSNGQNPFEFTGDINAPTLEEHHIGKFKGTVTLCAYVPSAQNFAFEAGVTGELTVDAGPVKKLLSAKGSATGWFQGTGNRFLSTDFNLDGSYQLQLPIIGNIAAKGVISSEGYAFCGTYHFISEGFGTHNWTDAPQELVGCDVSPFRATPRAADIAATASAAGARSVRVPAGETVFAMAIRSGSGAPRVRVTGPGGASFATPIGAHALTTRQVIVIPVKALHTTYVYLHRPRAGTWHVDPLAGARVTRIDTAHGLPKPHVTARLKRLHNGTLKLRWSARRIPGQRIKLVERAPGTAVTVQRLTGASHGTVTLPPITSLTTKRTIEADVFENGRPRAQVIALRYRVTTSKRPGAVTHLVATRTARGLSVSWRKAPRAANYLVTVTSGPDTIAATSITGTSILVPAAPAAALTVRVVARDRLGRRGPTVSVQLR